jgi:type IV pilus assembly protein PilW
MRYLNNLKQQGFSLIEIMIALVIGIVLLGGAVNIFISNNSVYRLESELSRMQESGRFLIEVMSKEIRMSGFSGCSSRGALDINVLASTPPPVAFASDISVNGFNDDGTNTWNPVLNGNAIVPLYDIGGDATKDLVSGTDVINIQRADSCSASLTTRTTTGDGATFIVNESNQCDFEASNVVIVTDCTNADVFALHSVPSSTGGKETLTHSTTLNAGVFSTGLYDPDSQIFKMRSNTFFVATGTATDKSGTRKMSLYQATWNPSDTNILLTAADFSIMELADGVEDLQILYGEDTGGGNEYADAYVSANNVADWANIRSVRVNLLLRSEDNITTQSRAFTFMGANANTGNDNRLRMVFSTTITLRNRLP